MRSIRHLGNLPSPNKYGRCVLCPGQWSGCAKHKEPPSPCSLGAPLRHALATRAPFSRHGVCDDAKDGRRNLTYRATEDSWFDPQRQAGASRALRSFFERAAPRLAVGNALVRVGEDERIRVLRSDELELRVVRRPLVVHLAGSQGVCATSDGGQRWWARGGGGGARDPLGRRNRP